MGYARSFSRHFPRTLHLAAAPEGCHGVLHRTSRPKPGGSHPARCRLATARGLFRACGGRPGFRGEKHLQARAAQSPFAQRVFLPASSQGTPYMTTRYPRSDILFAQGRLGPDRPSRTLCGPSSSFVGTWRPAAPSQTAAKGLAADWLAKVRAGRAAPPENPRRHRKCHSSNRR